MLEFKNPYLEKRKFERKPLQIPSSYFLNDIECPCHIIDISSQGIGMRVKGLLAAGDEIKITLGVLSIKSKVVRVDGNIVGVTFEMLTDEQLNYTLTLKKDYTG